MLKDILKHYERGNYSEGIGEWRFGKNYGESEDVSAEGASEWSILQQIVAELDKHAAVTADSSRTSLRKPARFPEKEILELLRRLPKTGPAYQALEHLLRIAEEGSSDLGQQNESEDLERRYAAEIVGKLEGMVRRAAKLERLQIEVPPNLAVKRAFEEAHRCYIYGFNLATAVMCRTIVEAALIENVDPDARLRRKARDENNSYILLLAKRAKINDGTFEEVEKIKKAGDDAVHDPQHFDQEHGVSEIEGNLRATRRLLLRLYRLKVAG